MAAPKPAKPPRPPPAGAARLAASGVPESTNTPNATPRIASTLVAVRIVCTRPPSMTPAQLMAAKTAMTPTAISWRGPKEKL